MTYQTMTSEKLAQLKPKDIQISPDGQYLSFLTETYDERTELHVRTFGEQGDLVILPAFGKAIIQYQWSYLPDILLFTQSKLGEYTHIYALNLKTNTTRCLTPFSRKNATISPKLLTLSPCNRSEILVALNLDDTAIHDVYRIDLNTGAVTLDTKNPGDVESWTTDVALNVRGATVVNKDGSTELQYRSYRNRAFGDWKTVASAKAGEMLAAISLSALTGKLYFMRGAGNLQLWTHDPQTGEESLVYDDKASELVTLEINPATQEVDALLFNEKTLFLSEELKAEFSQLKTIRQRKFSVLARSLSNELLVVASFSKRGTVKYSLLNKKINYLKTL